MNSHFIQVILSFLKIIPPLLLISFVSFFFIKIFKIKGILGKLILFFIFNWIQIIISIEILSLFKLVSYWPLMFFYLFSAIICAVISIVKKINLKINLRNAFFIFSNFFQGQNFEKIVKIIILVLLILAVFISFFIGINVPPSNYDSMTYHLARAAFWNQNHSIDHYNTQYALQNVHPQNGEIGLLWIIIFTNADILGFLVQWFSYILIIITLYKLLRLLKYNRLTSLFTTFVFAFMDIVFLESNSTQNDLVAASFLIVAFYYLVKSAKDEKINFFNIVLVGLVSGLTIGTKGYIYLFIPGFLIFFILYEKHNKQKYLKLLYIALLTMAGVFLFASYNLIQNYIYYGNFINDPKSIDLYGIKNTGIKPLISNFTRNISSFYQLKDFDNNTLGAFIINTLNKIHNSIKISLSDKGTTWPGYSFFLNGNPINYDDSYFGPLGFFIVLPITIINLLLIFLSKRLRQTKETFEKYKTSIIILIIPALFFIGYSYLFKWHQWGGRLLIAFVMFLIINLAEFFDLIKSIRIKIFYYIVITLLLIWSSYNSYFLLFKNSYLPLIKVNDSNIFSTSKYEDRRVKFAPGKMGIMNKNKEIVDEETGISSNLGLASDIGEWVYIYFGNNFKRKVFYLTEDDQKNLNLDEIFKKYKLDALILNSSFLPKNFNIFKNLKIMEINYSNYKDKLIPLNQCDLSVENKSIKINAYGIDPYLEIQIPEEIKTSKLPLLFLSLEIKDGSLLQLFYKRYDSNYNEKDSVEISVEAGINNLIIPIKDFDNLVSIRLDPINNKTDCKIDEISLIDFKNYEMILNNNYIILFNK